MFYVLEVKDHIRVPPELFGTPKDEAVLKCIKKEYSTFASKDLGIVIDVLNVKEIKEGIIIPGDGASYYETYFDLLTYKPEMQEVVYGKVKDITDFGAFLTIGPAEGMVHISQTMDDFVSFSKEKTLAGRDTKHTLKIGDKCKARIIAISFKESFPKLGLTMRQPGLGKLEWAKESPKPKEAKEEKKAKEKKQAKEDKK